MPMSPTPSTKWCNDSRANLLKTKTEMKQGHGGNDKDETAATLEEPV